MKIDGNIRQHARDIEEYNVYAKRSVVYSYCRIIRALYPSLFSRNLHRHFSQPILRPFAFALLPHSLAPDEDPSVGSKRVEHIESHTLSISHHHSFIETLSTTQIECSGVQRTQV